MLVFVEWGDDGNMGVRGKEFVMRHFSYVFLAKKFIENC